MSQNVHNVNIKFQIYQFIILDHLYSESRAKDLLEIHIEAIEWGGGSGCPPQSGAKMIGLILRWSLSCQVTKQPGNE